MSRSTVALLALAPLVVIVIVALMLLHRQNTRDYGIKPPASTAPAAPVVATPTPPTSTSTAAPEIAVTPPPPPTTPPPPALPPPNEDGVALLPQVKPAAPAPAPADAATDPAMFGAFAPDGRVLVARQSGRLQFIDLSSGQRQNIEMELAKPRAVGISAAGDRVAVANADSTEIWHVTSSNKTRLTGGDVTAIAFTPGDRVITGNSGGEIKFWDGPSWANTSSGRPGVGAVAHIAQSKTNAHLLAVIGASGGVAVCDTGDRAVKQRLGADQAWTSIAFSPDGRTLAAAGPRGVTMWDAMLWQTRPAPGGNEPATHVAFWRTGTVLVTAGADGAIHIYDVATRQLLTTLSGGDAKSTIGSLDLSDDGRTILTTSSAGITIWDSVARTSRALER